MSTSSVGTNEGGEKRGARNDERQTPIIPVQPINGVCRVYITGSPMKDDEEPSCYICKEKTTAPLISPCQCTGSSAFVHQECIEDMFEIRGEETCTRCHYRIPTYRTLKPIMKVRSDMLSSLTLIRTLFQQVKRY